MIGVVAVTDHDWYQFLSQQPSLDEVNFWRPSDTRTPRQLVSGAPVFFKLRKSDGDAIAGFGIFARHDVLPAWLAWDSFQETNGAASMSDMLARIGRLRRDKAAAGASAGDFEIGCLMLSQPVFFSPGDWVRPPAGWPETAVQGKGYDLSSGEGARIWDECRMRAIRYPDVGASVGVHREESPRYGEGSLVKPRLGQGTFRIAVTAAYGRCCAVSLEHSLPALEAAHIRPYAEGGEHAIPNGLLLRSDIHRLFDRGYVGVTPDHHFVVSEKLRDDYSNGRSYYPLHGRLIQLPPEASDRPDRSLLEWHLANLFRG